MLTNPKLQPIFLRDTIFQREREVTFPTERNASGREGGERDRSQVRPERDRNPRFGGGGEREEEEEASKGYETVGLVARASGLK